MTSMRIRFLISLGAAMLGLSCSTPKPAAPARLRILSYNIHHAEGTDGRLDVERIARVIREVNPDLVALQEVDDRAERTQRVNQTAELAKLTGLNGSFGQAMPFQGGGYGQAIFSRWPITATVVHNLPQQPRREPRIAYAANIDGRFIFASTHLDHEVESIRREQARQLETSLRTNQLPVILAGDFNATPDSETLKTFATQWTDAAAANPEPTIPSENPRRRIDYILLHPPGAWRVIETRVLNEPTASDHRPVLATIEFIR